ncbi:MAG: MarR family transcriptional regulator [Acidimicrobiales bacterium]
MTERASDLADLQRALVLLVRRTSVPRVHDRILRRAGVDIDRVEVVALSRIADAGSLRVRALAADLGVAPSTAGRHATALAERGLVTRAGVPDDARGVVVTATDAGRRLLAEVRTAHAELLDAALADWSGPDLAALARLAGRAADDLAELAAPELGVPA